MKIDISNPPVFKIKDCKNVKASSRKSVEEYKVWTILRTETAIRVDCDGEQLFDLDVTNCSTNKDWWDKQVNFVRFGDDDSASEQYRAASLGEFD